MDPIEDFRRGVARSREPQAPLPTLISETLAQHLWDEAVTRNLVSGPPDHAALERLFGGGVRVFRSSK